MVKPFRRLSKHYSVKPNMSIDVLFIILLAMAAFKGYSRGLIVSIFSFVAVVLGLAAALKLSAVVANWLTNHINVGTQWLPILSFAIVFIAIVWLTRLAANMLEKTIEFALMGWVNKIGGIVLYLMIYTIVLSVVLFYVTKIQLIKAETLSASQFYPFIEPWGPKAISAIGTVIPFVKDVFGQLGLFFDQVAKALS